MDPPCWERLKRNWDDLTAIHLKDNDILEILFSKGVISLEEREGTENMKDLLHILRIKPGFVGAYGVFMEALKEDYEHLVIQIEKTKVTTDPSVKAKGDPAFAEPRVREILMQEFKQVKGQKIELSAIKDVLLEKKAFGDVTWSNKYLQDYLPTLFNGIHFEKQPRKVVYVKSLCRLTEAGDVANVGASSTDAISEVQMSKSVKIMSCAELCEFLGPHLQGEDFPTEEILTNIQKQKITGKVFLSLTEEDFTKNLPDFSFAIHRTLSLLVKELNSPIASALPEDETLRSFDNPVTHLTMYRRGFKCDPSVGAKGSLVSTARMFFMPDEKDRGKLSQAIAAEVIPFASACLNKRQNGTAYFGINSFSGEIIGIHLDEQELMEDDEDNHAVTRQTIKKELDYFMEKSFIPTQQEIVKHCIKDAKFVPVSSYSPLAEVKQNRWVIEVDIKPSSKVLKKEEVIITILKLFPTLNKKGNVKETIFGFSVDGTPKPLSAEEQHILRNDLPRIRAQREHDECELMDQAKPDLGRRLLKLLTGGDGKREGIYYFVMLSPVDGTNLDAANVQFILDLKPEIVFDFDPSGSSLGLYNTFQDKETMFVITTDDFDESKNTQRGKKEMKEKLSNRNRISWMFVNGRCESESLQPIAWNKKRKTFFKECLRHFIMDCRLNIERVVVIMCLFSKSYETMIDASQEVLTELGDNWMLLAETEDIAKKWQSEMRRCVEEQDLDERCFLGLPFADINMTIQQILQPSRDICQLPTSKGTLAKVTEKKLKDWYHVDLVSATFEPPQDDADYVTKVEENFYRGEQADWPNFYFDCHVLDRDLRGDLEAEVLKALTSHSKDTRNKIKKVILTHQPMAGGTTMAKQVLWNLRKKYRCCKVKKIIPRETACQLKEIYTYGDETPKPLLVMLDNMDEFLREELLVELQEEIRKMSSCNEDNRLNVCVAMICERKASKDTRKGGFYLGKLSKKELQWFSNRYDLLDERFQEDKAKHTDPELLLSLNILKENYNKEYIQTALSQFANSVKEDWEVKLLKIVSFLQHYDTHFEPLSFSCLRDLVLNKSMKRSQENKKWVTSLSTEASILLNVSTGKGAKEITVCIFNRLVAKGVLKILMEREGQKTSDVMVEVLDSQMFLSGSQDISNLIESINRIIRTRLIEGRKLKFSQFVSDVQEEENKERVVDVLQQALDMTGDEFTAQVIARYFTRVLKNWKKAQTFAKHATVLNPKNSHLYDTCGQVYLCQVQEEMSNHSKPITNTVINKWISLSMEGLKYFKKAEEVDAEREEVQPSQVGFMNQLETIETILKAFKRFLTKESFRWFQSFLVKETSEVPPDLSFLDGEEVQFLQSLREASEEALLKLNDDCVQMKQIYKTDINSCALDFKKLESTKDSLESFFGASKDKGKHNYSLAKQRGGTHLNELLKLKEDNSSGKLRSIFGLMKENVELSKSQQQFPYLLTLIGTCTMLILIKSCPPELQYNTLLSWCHRLVQKNKQIIPDKNVLETYLYFIMYNFPTEERKKYKLCSNSELKSAMESAIQAFKHNYPKYFTQSSRRRRYTTLFFLGVGRPLEDIIHTDQLSSSFDGHFDKWQEPTLKDVLCQLQGTLLHGGDTIEFSQLEIRTSFPIVDQEMWQKPVNFYLAFSWTGPLAYGIVPAD